MFQWIYSLEINDVFGAPAIYKGLKELRLLTCSVTGLLGAWSGDTPPLGEDRGCSQQSCVASWHLQNWGYSLLGVYMGLSKSSPMDVQ